MYGFLNEMMKKRIERNFALKLKKKKAKLFNITSLQAYLKQLRKIKKRVR